MEKPCFKWICNVKNIHLDKQLLSKCLARIPEDDKSRIGKFTNKNDAVSCLIGRLMIRKYATSALNISNEDLVIKRDGKGRPYIQNGKPLICKDLDFNVSHQGDYVAFIGTKNGPVGIDIMEFEKSRLQRKEEFFRLMNRQFSQNEWGLIRSAEIYDNILPGYDPQLATFYRLWSLKESYVKAIGIGIGFDLQRISFELNEFNLSRKKSILSTKVIVDGKKTEDFVFEETLVDSSYIVAVCAKKESMINSTNFLNVSVVELLSSLTCIMEIDDEYCMNLLSKK